MQQMCISDSSQVWVTLTGICRAEYFISKFLRKSKCIYPQLANIRCKVLHLLALRCGYYSTVIRRKKVG